MPCPLDSIQVTDTKQGHKATACKKDVADLATLDWHSVTAEEVCTRLGVSPDLGLDKEIAARRMSKDGKNVMSKRKTNWPKKISGYIFSGFGGLLLGASIICFIAWCVDCSDTFSSFAERVLCSCPQETSR